LPRGAKFCLLSLLLASSLVTFVSFRSETYAVDLARTFFNGETAIGFWIKHGVLFWTSVLIAILISTWDIRFWFSCFDIADWCIEKIKSLYKWFVKKAEPFYRRIPRSELVMVRESFPEIKKERFSRVYRWGKKIYLFFKPQPQIDAEARRKLGIRPYLMLPFFGVTPGFIWSGIQYSRETGLNQTASFLLISAGNALKMVIAGYVSLRIGIWGVVGIVAGFTVAKFTKDYFRKRSGS